MEKQYKINVDARILELLGPNLYTNVYYVLAELIANAYDADAKNVYVILEDNQIIVEDDGKGMSYQSGDVNNFLSVAKESRKSAEDSKTKLGRYKMGRKGVGKLAALSISENVEIRTISKDGEKSGFILNRAIPDDGLLTPIEDKDINFFFIKTHGTSIVMKYPHYKPHKTLSVVKKNIQRIFPIVSEDFVIHLQKGKERIEISDFDKSIVNELAGIITIGDDFKYLNSLFQTDFANSTERLNKNFNTQNIELDLLNKVTNSVEKYELSISGWMGVYKTTKNRKADATDFPDNFISVFANGKLGEFNILPNIGQNKLTEVYVVSQLHVDLFEETTLPDMALSNRQGYKTEDERYVKFIEYVRGTLLPQALEQRNIFGQLTRAKKNKKRNEKNKQSEAEFKNSVEEFKKMIVKDIASESSQLNSISSDNVEETINKNIHLLGLKPSIDSQKRELLISHTGKDKLYADLIYDFSIYNGIPDEKIIYTNCDSQVSRIPEGENGEYPIYDYLRDFFVDSISTKKPYVIFITSSNMHASWGAVVEVGAAWITKNGHKIFNINNVNLGAESTITSYSPSEPLDVGSAYNNTNIDYIHGDIYFNRLNMDDLSNKIEFISRKLGYQPKSREENISFLTDRVVSKEF